MNEVLLQTLVFITSYVFLGCLIGCIVSAILNFRRIYAVFFWLAVCCVAVLLVLCFLLDPAQVQGVSFP